MEQTIQNPKWPEIQRLRAGFAKEPTDIQQAASTALCELRAPVVRCVELYEMGKAFRGKGSDSFKRLLVYLANDESEEVAERAKEELRKLGN